MPKAPPPPAKQLHLLRQFFPWWVALAIIAVGTAGFFVLRGPWREWRALARTQGLEAELTAARAIFGTLQAEAQAWIALGAVRTQQVETMLPSDTDVPNLLAQLEAVSRAAGFSIDAVSTAEGGGVRGSRAPAGGVRQLKVTLSVGGGSYPKLRALLATLQRSWRLVQVDSFGVGGGEGSYRLELTAFYYPR